jgi:hypothetical protein
MKKSINKMQRNRIDLLCTRYNIKNYSITPDGFIDVNGSVDLTNYELTKIPMKFNIVSGDFDCSENSLTTLVGSPVSVGGFFGCDYNQLTTLEGCPENVGIDFFASKNKLICTYSGNADIEYNGKIFLNQHRFTQSLRDNIHHIKLILKYQRHYYIWNDDLTLNVDNFQELLAEIKDGLE